MKRWSKWIKITLLSLAGGILLILGIVFTFAYFKGSQVLKKYLIETVYTGSRGLYRLETGDLHITIIPGWISIRDVVLTPDTVLFRKWQIADSSVSKLFSVKISRIQVRGVDFIGMLRKQKFEINKVIIIGPEIKIDIYKPTGKKEEPESRQTRHIQINLPAGIQSLKISEVRVLKGSFRIIDHRTDSLKEIIFPSITVETDNIHADHSGTPDPRLFNADDIRIRIADYSMFLAKGIYKLSFGELRLSTGNSSLTLNKFSLAPTLGRKEFAKKAVYQADQMNISVNEISLSGLKLDSAVLKGKILASRLTVNGLLLDDFRDQSYPRKPGLKPPLPQDLIPKIPVRFSIDTVCVEQSKAIYSEQKNAGPGTVSFADLQGKLYPLTNDSLKLQQSYTMHLVGSALLMDKGRLTAAFAFKVPDKHSSFNLKANIGSMDLMEFNKVVTPLAGIMISSGKLIKMEIPNISFTDFQSTGILKFYYSDLEIKLIRKDSSSWTNIKTSVLGFAANTYVGSDNPNRNGKFREGVIRFHRDTGKSIFNYLWKSVFTGLKSTVGINNKEQKEIRKERKAKKK